MEMNDPIYLDCKDKNSFQSGMSFQDFVCIELAKHGIILQNIASKKYQFEIGENLQGFEIKLDTRFLETNRLSIEIAEKSKADIPTWTPSGIYRSDNSWLYIQGNYQRFYIFAKNFLINLHRYRKYEEAESPKEFPTVRKFYLPLNDAQKYAVRIFEFRENGQ